jgi:hypothetical protein
VRHRRPGSANEFASSCCAKEGTTCSVSCLESIAGIMLIFASVGPMFEVATFDVLSHLFRAREALFQNHLVH